MHSHATYESEGKENDDDRPHLFGARHRDQGKDKKVNEPKILVIDDDPEIVESLTEYLTDHEFDVRQADSLRAAYRIFEEEQIDIAIVDYRLPDGDALEFLSKLKQMNVLTETIVLTGYGSIDLAVKATKEGAFHFMTKPVQFAVLTSLIRSCLEGQKIRRKQMAVSVRLTRLLRDPFEGTSDAIGRLKSEVLKIVHTERPILIQGETGTGKGVLADWIHKCGRRKEEAFVDLNCAGLGTSLMESELFGHEKGAFTGAVSAKQGLIELAHRGILFLDEIGEMDITVQAKLLKVLEEKRFRRVGEVRQRTADIQVIAATNRDIEKSVREMKFREDLYYRLGTFHLRIPSLRERPEDIPALARTILSFLAKDVGRGEKELSPEAIDALQNYRWPGNIRELRNVLERVTLTCESRVVGPKTLGLPGPSSPGSAQGPVNSGRPAARGPAGTETKQSIGVLDEVDVRERPGGAANSHESPDPWKTGWPTWLTWAEIEKQHILRVLDEEGGKVSQAAARLGIPRSSLYQKLRAWGIKAQGE